MDTLKTMLEMFRKPSAKVIAQRELEDAQREYLVAQSTTEYAKQMAQYHADRVKRLQAYIQRETA